MQAEIEALKEALDSAQHELEHRRHRQLSTAPSSAALGAQQAVAAVQAADGERVALRLRYGAEGDGLAPAVTVALEVQPAAAAAGGSSGAEQQALPAALAALAAAGGGGAGSVDPQLLQAAGVALAQLAREQGVALPGFGPAASPDLSRSDAAAAAGGDADALQAQCNALQLQVGRLQAALEQAQHDAAFVRDAAERKQQELRSRLAEAQQRQGEVLRVAQDSRLDAGWLVGWRGRSVERRFEGLLQQHALPGQHVLKCLNPPAPCLARHRVAMRGGGAPVAGGRGAGGAAGGGGSAAAG